MTPLVRIAIYIGAGIVAGQTSWLTFDPESYTLSLQLDQVAAGLSGTMVAGAITWWRIAKKRGGAT